MKNLFINTSKKPLNSSKNLQIIFTKISLENSTINSLRNSFRNFSRNFYLRIARDFPLGNHLVLFFTTSIQNSIRRSKYCTVNFPLVTFQKNIWKFSIGFFFNSCGFFSYFLKFISFIFFSRNSYLRKFFLSSSGKFDWNCSRSFFKNCSRIFRNSFFLRFFFWNVLQNILQNNSKLLFELP